MRYLLIGCLLFLCCCTKKKPKVKEDSTPKYNFPVLTNTSITFEPIDSLERLDWVQKIENFTQINFKNNRFSGQLLVAKNNQIIYYYQQGYTSFRDKTPMSTDASIHIASASKPFTAFAIMKLVENNQLSLKDSLRQFFPELPYSNITIRDLLSHRSGLPNYVYFTSDSAWWDKSKTLTNKDVIEVMKTFKPRRNVEPNTRFKYCNTNYVLLASIVEQVTGEKFHTVLDKMIFEPLKMNNTFVFKISDTLTVAPSFDYKGNKWPYNFHDGTVGDKNVYSTAHDLLKFHRALLDTTSIDPNLLKQMFTPQSEELESINNYGLGFRTKTDTDKDTVIYHNGQWHGNNSSFIHLPKDSVSIIVLGNKYTRLVYSSMEMVYFFGNYPVAIPEEEIKDSLDSMVFIPRKKALIPEQNTSNTLDSLVQQKNTLEVDTVQELVQEKKELEQLQKEKQNN